MPTITLRADTAKELEEAIEQYLIDYHPAGYGTYVRDRYTTPEGTHCATIWRGTTAD